MQKAIIHIQVSDIVYLSLEKKKTSRKIEPIALVHTQENCMLIAFCMSRDNFRAFRLDCIQSLVVNLETFESHNMTIEEYYEDLRKKHNSQNNP